LVFNRQTLDQLRSRPFNSGDMHEHIRAARIRDQEPIAFCKIEPLHGALHDLGAPIHSGVPLITRKGNDLTRRFPFIAMAVAALPVPSCLIDGEAIVSDDDGRAVFDRIRGHGTLAGATLCAFDLLQVDGRDLRREPLEARRRALAKLLRRSHSSLVVNEHFEGDGAIVFREACRLGCEGIVSKRLGSPYRSGRTISSAIVVGDRRTTANGELGRQLGTIARDKGRQAARFVGSNRKGIRWT
jgi:hypothetical protein